MFVFDSILYRLKKGCQTMSYPKGEAPALPDQHGGALRLDATQCPDDCQACAGVCPTNALARDEQGKMHLDLNRCLFCGQCIEACPTGAIQTTGDHRMATRRPEDLILGEPEKESLRLAEPLDKALLKLWGRSFKLRQVSAGGCNACEADTNVLGTIGWDFGRFGIQFVASPRHADGLLITGPVTTHMELALKKAYEALPEPKIVIAVGACALSGGPFRGHEQQLNGVSSVIPVDLFIPGCPPHPLTILDGLLRLLGKIVDK